eukprot:CAMPEP_0185207932 /NCGR_PEP_ID=MMETSP1140-20130426/61159_1 /TAXON_ID=298111 /ORGANISM="Pavlova sp., Strain CCMP459" /LENGTH=119 /DNA_ID=CAMNT_0027775635 /DNA_START=421 /DNA_END=778 /DNA_ORIENTATION=-
MPVKLLVLRILNKVALSPHPRKPEFAELRVATVLNRLSIGEAKVAREELLCACRTSAALTVQVDLCICAHPLRQDALGDILHRRVDGACDVPRIPLCVGAHVNNLCLPGVEVVKDHMER